MEQLILVDSHDREIGFEEKEKCHIHPTKLHRAFSIFLFNDKGDLLITKRNKTKKTWPGFWSNTVCSHPRKGEKQEDAVVRRLKEEMGVSVPLKYLFKFQYQADYDGKWGENELDWVFFGRFDGIPKSDKDEIDDWKFISSAELKKDVKSHPGKYTPWFKLCLERVLKTVLK